MLQFELSMFLELINITPRLVIAIQALKESLYVENI